MTAPVTSGPDWIGSWQKNSQSVDAYAQGFESALFGGNIPHHVQFDGGAGNWLIDGDNISVPSTKNQSISSKNTAQLYQEWDQWISSANKMRFVLWNAFGNPSAPTGWEQSVVHMGPTVDGDPGGSKQADLEWNVAGKYGSLSICGYASHCGFRVNGDGTPVLAQDTALLNGIKVTVYPAQSGIGAPTFYSSGADRFTIGSSDGGVSTIEAGKATFNALGGTGNAYACLDASGNLYRSATACN